MIARPSWIWRGYQKAEKGRHNRIVAGTLLALGIAVVLIGRGIGGSGSSTPSVSPPLSSHPVAGRHIHAVFLIVMENHDWSAIKGNSSAPYINHVLLPSASYATQYYNPPGVHPSLPNYLWLEAGTNCFPNTGCILDDSDPSSHPIHSTSHLVTLLQRSGISWRAYEESIGGSTCPLQTQTFLQFLAENGAAGLSQNLYAAKHDPFVYFADTTNNFSSSSPTCVEHIRPFSSFAADLRQGRTAQYNFITPNLCDDMHTSCPMFSNTVKQGDSWLSRVVPLIQKSRAYRHGGAIFITWDEGSPGDGPIGFIVLSPEAKGHGYSNAIHYTHSSTVRTIEEIFNVRPFLGDSGHAKDLRDLFRRFP